MIDMDDAFYGWLASLPADDLELGAVVEHLRRATDAPMFGSAYDLRIWLASTDAPSEFIHAINRAEQRWRTHLSHR